MTTPTDQHRVLTAAPAHHNGVYRREHRHLREMRHRQVRGLLAAPSWRQRFEYFTVGVVFASICVTALAAVAIALVILVRMIDGALRAAGGS